MSNEITPTENLNTDPELDWTIMVYLAGDNNLSEAMIGSIKQMVNNLNDVYPNKIALLAYYDSATPSYPTVYIDFTGKKSEMIQQGALKGPQIAFPTGKDKESRSSTGSIKKFVHWCVKKKGYKAKNYALILSGHGDGFQPDTFLHDQNPFSHVTVGHLGQTLTWICQEYLGEQNFSILGLDSCVMSTIEFAYEMSHVADTLISSQGLVPSLGWDYHEIITRLQNELLSQKQLEEAKNNGEIVDEKKFQELELSRQKLARIFVESYVSTNYDYAFYGNRSIDINCCDLTIMDATVDAVNELAAVLLESLQTEGVDKKIEQVLLTSHWKCQTHIVDQCVDIKDFCINLKI